MDMSKSVAALLAATEPHVSVAGLIKNTEPQLISLSELRKLPIKGRRELIAIPHTREKMPEICYDFVPATDTREINMWFKDGLTDEVTVWTQHRIELPPFEMILDTVKEADDLSFWEEPPELDGIDEFKAAYERFCAAQTFKVFDRCVYRVWPK